MKIVVISVRNFILKRLTISFQRKDSFIISIMKMQSRFLATVQLHCNKVLNLDSNSLSYKINLWVIVMLNLWKYISIYYLTKSFLTQTHLPKEKAKQCDGIWALPRGCTVTCALYQIFFVSMQLQNFSTSHSIFSFIWTIKTILSNQNCFLHI